MRRTHIYRKSSFLLQGQFWCTNSNCILRKPLEARKIAKVLTGNRTMSSSESLCQTCQKRKRKLKKKLKIKKFRTLYNKSASSTRPLSHHLSPSQRSIVHLCSTTPFHYHFYCSTLSARKKNNHRSMLHSSTDRPSRSFTSPLSTTYSSNANWDL